MCRCPNEPLLIIDGVRINNDANSSTINIGEQAPSRLNDLKPGDIESIDILKGPRRPDCTGRGLPTESSK